MKLMKIILIQMVLMMIGEIKKLFSEKLIEKKKLKVCLLLKVMKMKI